jgi:hypothetical protein
MTTHGGSAPMIEVGRSISVPPTIGALGTTEECTHRVSWKGGPMANGSSASITPDACHHATRDRRAAMRSES